MSGQPSWTDPTLDPPHAAPDKARRVRAMFESIAPAYDLNNRLHSLGRDQAWRRAAVRAARLRAGDVVLDVACGTGDLTLALARALAALAPAGSAAPADGQVTGLDFAPAMLDIARRKAARCAGVRWVCGDAMALPLADQSVDVATIAFGLRNLADAAAGLREFHRVLRPGGRAVVLEFSTPGHPLVRRLYGFYFHHVLPRTAALVARDRAGAYRYLPRSVDTFLDPPGIARLMRNAGFAEVTSRPLTLGIAAITVGNRK